MKKGKLIVRAVIFLLLTGFVFLKYYYKNASHTNIRDQIYDRGDWGYMIECQEKGKIIIGIDDYVSLKEVAALIKNMDLSYKEPAYFELDPTVYITVPKSETEKIKSRLEDYKIIESISVDYNIDPWRDKIETNFISGSSRKETDFILEKEDLDKYETYFSRSESIIVYIPEGQESLYIEKFSKMPEVRYAIPYSVMRSACPE